MDTKTRNMAFAAAALLLAAAAYYMYSGSDKPEYVRDVAGIPVYSNVPLDSLENLTETIGLHTYETGAETTCNYEILGALKASGASDDAKGYEIRLQRGPAKVVLEKNGAYIMGETDEELLTACHAFLCMRNGLSCPKNLGEIGNIPKKYYDMILVLDNRTGMQAYMGYIELQLVYGYLQAQYADANGDGFVNQSEANANRHHIYSYLMYGDTCVLQESVNVLQQLNITNDTAPCEFRSAVILERSRTNGIAIDGQKIRITGDDRSIYTGALIVRDILAPEWVRVFNRANG